MMKIPLTFVVQFLSVFTSFSCLFKISSIKDVHMKTTRQSGEKVPKNLVDNRPALIVAFL